jgi:hypothetical protein
VTEARTGGQELHLMGDCGARGLRAREVRREKLLEKPPDVGVHGIPHLSICSED